MKKWVVWLIVVIAIVGTLGYVFIKEDSPDVGEIDDFESCIAAGNPAMESYPRQCRDPEKDRTFVENISLES